MRYLQYRKFEKSKVSYLLEKMSVLFIFRRKYENGDKQLFKDEESIEILKILGLVEHIQLL